jgi:hypothetical protein
VPPEAFDGAAVMRDIHAIMVDSIYDSTGESAFPGKFPVDHLVIGFTAIATSLVL